jgi:methylase of polypeptide subunit release factors
VQVYQIGRHRVTIACRDGVGPPTPYSLLLAEHIPEMVGQTAVDVGTGSGILAIVARLQRAARVYILDTNRRQYRSRWRMPAGTAWVTAWSLWRPGGA